MFRLLSLMDFLLGKAVKRLFKKINKMKRKTSEHLADGAETDRSLIVYAYLFREIEKVFFIYK